MPHEIFRENDLFLKRHLSTVMIVNCQFDEIYIKTLKCEHVSRLKKLLTGEKRKIFRLFLVLVNSSLLKKLRLLSHLENFPCLVFLFYIFYVCCIYYLLVFAWISNRQWVEPGPNRTVNGFLDTFTNTIIAKSLQLFSRMLFH